MKFAALILTFGLACVTLFAFENCSGGLPSDLNSTNKSSSTTPLSLASPGTLAIGQSVTLKATGGAPPYTYSLSTQNSTALGTSGTVAVIATLDSASGKFKALAAGDQDVIVTDANGQTAVIDVTIAAPVSATSPAPAPAPAPAPLPAPVVLASQPVYRFFNSPGSEHFFTVSQAEGNSAGYTYEGVGFKVLVGTGMSGTHPIYRCLYNGKHFISSDSGCDGTSTESTYGSVYNSQVSGSSPLFRFYLPSTGDHLETTGTSEGFSGGYQLEMTLGYVPN